MKMMSVVVATLLVVLSGCQGDVLCRMRNKIGGERRKKEAAHTCRSCGIELSRSGYCQTVGCDFSKHKQEWLRPQEIKFASEVDSKYSSLPAHDDETDKFRSKGLSGGWGKAWHCPGCNSPCSRWIGKITVDGKDYSGPFLCCDKDCEYRIMLQIRYELQKREKR